MFPQFVKWVHYLSDTVIDSGEEPTLRDTGWIFWAWQPTPVFLSGESHEQRSLEAAVHGITESERTEATKRASHTLVKCWCHHNDDMLLLLVLALGEKRLSYIQNRIFTLYMLSKINNLKYYHFVYNWFFKYISYMDLFPYNWNTHYFIYVFIYSFLFRATMLPHASGTSHWISRNHKELCTSSRESASSPQAGGCHHRDSSLTILNEDFLPFFPTKDIFSGLWNYCNLTSFLINQEKQMINTE